MLKNKYAALFLMLFGFQIVMSQSVEITGTIESNIGVENINIVNKNSYSYAITNADGVFKIMAKLNDSLKVSSMLHKTKYVVVNEHTLLLKSINITLEEQVNELREVTVGNTLSGNLLLDIQNIKGERPINFYDVGIPGYMGKISTQSERMLSEASSLDPKLGASLGGLGGSVSATALINAISGRTKMLKHRVEIERIESLIQNIKSRLAEDFFKANPLEEDLKMEFLYFCADDENFIELCKNQNDFEILVFLRMKYSKYLENRNDTRN